MTGYDTDTLQFYQTSRPDYAAAGPAGVSRHLHGFLALLPAGAKILDLGCGGGRDAQAMLDAGFDVVATDGVPAMAQLAEARLGRPVSVMRFDELESEEDYDAVWASASLLHVPRADLPRTLTRIHRALKEGGVHCATYKAGRRDGRDSAGRYFNYLNADQLLQAYRAAGEWDLIALVDYEGGGYESGLGPWLAITLRKVEPSNRNP